MKYIIMLKWLLVVVLIGAIMEGSTVAPGTTYPNGGRRMVIDSTGTFHVVYYNQDAIGNYYVLHKSSSDGINWTGPDTLYGPWAPNAPTTPDPSITIDPNDTLHVVFACLDVYYTKASAYNTTQWSQPLKLTNIQPPCYAERPVIDVDGNGGIHVAYEYDRGCTNQPRDIFYIAYDPSTLLWTNPPGVNVSNVINYQGQGYIAAMYPTIATAVDYSSVRAHVAWTLIPNTGTCYVIMYSNTANYGVNFSAPVNPAGIGEYSPVIAVDKNDNPHLIWQWYNCPDTIPQIFYGYSQDTGSTWNGPFGPVNNPAYAEQPSLMIDPLQRIQMVWDQINPPANFEIYHSLINNLYGNVWANPIQISIGDGINSRYPNLAYRKTSACSDIVHTDLYTGVDSIVYLVFCPPTFVDEYTLSENGINLQISPNPFTNSVEITFYIPMRTHVALKLYDKTGKLIESILNGVYSGKVSINYIPSMRVRENLAPGIYFLRLQTDSYTITKPIIFVK